LPDAELARGFRHAAMLGDREKKPNVIPLDVHRRYPLLDGFIRT
jgi:hypothetical protein